MPSVARRSLSSGTASLRSARTGRSDVVAITKPNGWVVERVRYDAYGRPGSFTPADLTGNANGPNNLVDSSDNTRFNAVWSVGGPVTWETDLSDTSGTAGPDGAAGNGDSVAYTT